MMSEIDENIQKVESVGSVLLYNNGYLYIFNPYIIQICPGITSGGVLDGELLYTKILEVNLFAFAYRLFHEDFSPINEAQPLIGEKSL